MFLRPPWCVAGVLAALTALTAFLLTFKKTTYVFKS
jgi:hypothetical protein